MQQLIIEKIALLGNVNLRCPSVIKNEGLHSPKAIAFIQSKSSQTRIRKETINYLVLGAIFQRTVLSQKQKTIRPLSKNLGEKLWIK
jgi:hypothetical protein